MRRKMMMLLGAMRLVIEYCLCAGKLKIHGIRNYFGKGSRILIRNNGYCDFGKKTWLGDFSYIGVNAGKITIGYNNFFNGNCRIIALEEITIGDNNLFGPNVVIVDHNHRFVESDVLICKQGFETKPVNIGSDIWIGANVTICAGVSICNRVVVAANSVVTTDIKEPGVYAGLPAKKKRDL